MKLQRGIFYFFGALFVFVFCAESYGQRATRPSDRREAAVNKPRQMGTNATAQPITDPIAKTPYDNMIDFRLPGDTSGDETLWRSAVEDAVKPTKEQKKRYESFLKQKDTGLMRLIPLEKISTVQADKNSAPIPGDCAFYSFNMKVHVRRIADIRLTNGGLYTGVAPLTVGMITPVGEMALEDVSLEMPEADKLANIKFPSEKDALKKLMAENAAAAKADLGHVYLLRSAGSGQWDHLIALKIVEKENDGNLLILWKRLYKGKAPKFKD